MAETSTQVARRQISLVEIGSGANARAISPVGYRSHLAYEHLQWHREQQDPRRQWCEMKCLARTMFQRDSQKNRAEARKRVARLFHWCLERGEFLLIEYDSAANGQIVAIKLHDAGAGEIERQYAQFQLERMERRRQIAGEKLERAQLLLDLRIPVSVRASQHKGPTR